MKGLDKAEKWFDRLLNGMAAIAGIILLFMMLVVCYDVLMRYILRMPVGWVVEVCEYLMIYLTFFGSAWLLREGGHVNVDILYYLISRKSIRRFKIFISFIGAVSTLFLVVYGTATTWDVYQRGVTELKMLEIPKWTLLWVIPFGSVFLSIEFFRQFFHYISKPEKRSAETEK